MFNTAYVLADKDTATDGDFERVEGGEFHFIFGAEILSAFFEPLPHLLLLFSVTPKRPTVIGHEVCQASFLMTVTRLCSFLILTLDLYSTFTTGPETESQSGIGFS